MQHIEKNGRCTMWASVVVVQCQDTPIATAIDWELAIIVPVSRLSHDTVNEM